ncbi:MAG: SAVED domain-containing protein, partial [Polyangiaceae bacterium]|nr:SAVED domain-containing protein [Polyangiaceae bacterium]
SLPTHLEQVLPEGGAAPVLVPAAHRYRLLFETGRRVEPEDLDGILRDVVELLGQLRRHGVEHIHLAFAGPDVVAFFLGQSLNALGRISLYEFYTDHYEFVFDLEERSAAPA